MLTEKIYETDVFETVCVRLLVHRHEYIGKGVIRVICEVNGQNAKRVNHPTYYPKPVWSVNDRIVADWFNGFLEIAYQDKMIGVTPIIHRNL